MTAFTPIRFYLRVRWSLHTLCQCVSFAFVMLWASSSVFAASADHTFTDQAGRTLIGKIISVAQPDVYLQSGAGQPFPVKIGAFTAKDQAYIQQWALDNQKSAQPFNIFALKNASADSTDDLPQQGFKVTLKNLTSSSVTKLRIEYVVLRQPTQGAGPPLPRITGSTSITVIAKNGEASFDTDLIPAKGSRTAVWVRVYNAQGKLLQEWSSSPAMTDSEQWSLTAGKGEAKHGSSESNKSSAGAGYALTH